MAMKITLMVLNDKVNLFKNNIDEVWFFM